MPVLPGIGDTSSRIGTKKKPSLPGMDVESGLSSIVGLEELASKEGFKESKVVSALKGISRVLNFGTATVAGAVRGALSQEGIIKGIKEGVENNIGFSDVIKDLVGEPTTRTGKIAIGAAGFAADVLFDPLTYLTLGFGSGLKVGGKVLSKGGTKLAQGISTELLESTAEKLVAEGIEKNVAFRLAKSDASRTVNDLFQRVLGKKGLTDEAAEMFIKKGINTQNIETIRAMGSKLIDEGGIKWFGKTLVKSETLGKTMVGKAAKRLGETEIVQALKNTAGNLFEYGYKKNPKVLEIINRAKFTSRRAIEGITKSVDTLFKDVSETEGVEFFSKVFDKRVEVLAREKEIAEKSINDINQLFPGLEIKNKDDAVKVFNSLEETTEKKVQKIRDEVDAIVKPIFEERQARIKANVGKELPGGTKDIATESAASFEKVDQLNKIVDDLKLKLAALRKERGAVRVGKPLIKELGEEITQDEILAVGHKIMRYEEERLGNLIDELSTKIEKKLESPGTGGSVGKVVGKKASPLESVVMAERLIKKYQDDVTTKSRLLTKIMDSRRLAKASQKFEKLTFENPKLQKIADKMFEGNGSIVAKLAKQAGISEEDAFKFYLPSKFRDQIAVKEFAIGRNLGSPSLGFQKDFKGVANEQLITNPAEALKRGSVDVANARIKDSAIQSVIRSMGIKDANGQVITELSEAEAKRLGVAKFTRKGVTGDRIGYLPKEVIEELNKFITPGKSTIDDLAKATGFDWATGLFKGYVTSLFPAFHVRNITSNQFQLMLKRGVDALNPAIQKRAFDIALGRNLTEEFVTKTGERMTNGKLFELIKKNSDLLDQGAFDVEERLAGHIEGTSLNPFSRRFAPIEAGRKVGSVAETQAKVTAVIGAIMEGKSVKEGIKDAEEALFNYSKLTDFEKSVMRRVIPFYTFARKNFEYQLKVLAHNPGRTAAQLKLINGIGESVGEPITSGDESGLPPWVVDSLGIKAGTNKFGQSNFLTGFGLPIEEFIQRFSGDKGIMWNAVHDTLTRANPLLKFPLERATGQDFFRDKPIAEISDASSLSSMLKAVPRPVRKELEDFLQYKEIPNQPIYVNGKVVGKRTKYVANPFALHVIRNLPTSRLENTVGFLADETQAPINKWLRFATGIRQTSIDQEEQKYFADLKKKEELTAFLTRMGVIGTKEILFEKNGEPKDKSSKKRKVTLPGLE